MSEERTMEAEQQRAAKEQMFALMQAGHRWQEAAAQAGIQVSRSTAYRLMHQVRTRGKAAFQDGRHGHPAKLRAAPQAVWCRRPSRNGLASRSVSAISTRSVPVSAWEAALLPRGKKLDAASSSPAEPQWQEGAGGLLLVAAAQETGLLSAMET